MTHRIYLPAHLGEEFGRISPGGRRVVHDLLAAIADNPHAVGEPEPLASVHLRRAMTAPAPDTGDRVTLLYRVHAADDGGFVEIVWILHGP